MCYLELRCTGKERIKHGGGEGGNNNKKKKTTGMYGEITDIKEEGSTKTSGQAVCKEELARSLWGAVGYQEA